MMRDYDAIVIGSGAGGLAAAVALANAGQRVLVLEQHDTPGGWCHSFTLDKRYRFSPGVHYIGELAPGAELHKKYQGLGVSQDLAFVEINPDGYDHFFVGKERFDVPAGHARYLDRMLERFPKERKGITRFFELIHKVVGELAYASSRLEGWRKMLLPFVAPHAVFHAKRSLQTVFQKNIEDPLARAFLSGLGGNYAAPPNDTSFLLHALTQAHYFEGAYYPKDGAFRIPRAFLRQLKRMGGEVRLSTSVKRILIKKGRAVGVEIESSATHGSAKTEQLYAPVIVSNADPEMTFRQLVGAEHLGRGLRRKLQHTSYSSSCVSLFVATELNLRELGLDGGNHWLFSHPDINRIYDNTALYPKKKLEMLFLSATSLKDPGKQKHHEHTIEMITWVPYQAFGRWANQPSQRRDDAYQALKQHIAKEMLEKAEELLPNLRQHITFMNVGSPLTNKQYCMSHQGAMYGTNTTLQAGGGLMTYPNRTEIQGLFMVGASTLCHGVVGVTESGLSAAAAILNCRTRDLLRENGPPIPIIPHDAPIVS